MLTATESTEVWLATTEAALIMGLSKRTLERWREVGGGPTFVQKSRVVRYRKSAIEAWSKRNSFDNAASALAPRKKRKGKGGS